MLPGTTPKNRPLVFGKKGAERLHIIYIVRTFSIENFTSFYSYVVNAHTIVNSVYLGCIILLPSHQDIMCVTLQQIFRVFYAFGTYTGTNATFEFLLRYMSIIKKATLSDITLLFSFNSHKFVSETWFLAEREKFFQFFIDFIFIGLQKGQSMNINMGRFANDTLQLTIS